MAKPLVTDELWEVIEPLLPEEPPKPKGGRPRVPDRAALTGILFVLKTGIPWEMLPQEMGCACTERCSTAWDRRTNSTGSGRRSTRRAYRPPGGTKTGKNPTDRGKQGSKRHLVVDRGGRPSSGQPLGGQRPRLEDAGGDGGRYPAGPRAAGPPGEAAQASAQQPGRQRLRQGSYRAPALQDQRIWPAYRTPRAPRGGLRGECTPHRTL